MTIPTKSIYLSMLLQEIFIWTSANSGLFITYICVRGINNVLFMPAWNIHDFDFGNIECHYWCAPSNRASACLYAGSADEDRGGNQSLGWSMDTVSAVNVQ